MMCTKSEAMPRPAPRPALGLQRRLTVNAPGDRHEREADRAADSVVLGRGRPSLSARAPGALQREDDKKKEPPTPLGEGLATVGKNLGENNPAFSLFSEKLATRFLAQPAPISIGVPAFLGANYAFLWGMALIDPAMRRSFDDFNLAMLPGLVPQFPVKTFQYRILDGAQTRFAFDIGLDASKLMLAFNEGVLNTRVSSVKFDTSGKLDTSGPKPLALSALQVQLGLFGDGMLLTGGFRNGISPYPLMGDDGARVMAQTPALPDLYANQRDVRFTLQLDLLKLASHFGATSPAPRAPEQLQREATGATPVAEGAAGAAVQSTLACAGAPLDAATRGFMESRFGHDFSRVRIHADMQAAASAQSVGARAYTVGADLVFGRGQYAPATPAGRHLLAHELAHVVQQKSGGDTGLVQRALLSARELDDFETDAFAVANLQSYLAGHGPGRIEDNNDSDDKARRIVRLWKNGDAPFVTLTADQKILLIQEMQSGFTANDDERGILALLLGSPEDLSAIFTAIDPAQLDTDFQGDEEDVLRAFYDRNFVGGRKAALRGSRRLVARDGAAAKAGPTTADPAEAAKTAEPEKRKGEQDLMVLLDPKLKVLADVLSATAPVQPKSPAELATLLANIKQPIGTMYVLSHGDDSASIKIGSTWHTPEKVAAALVGKVPAGREPGLIDFRGCRIGMSPPGMETIRAALGAGAVVGSTCWMVSTPLGATSFDAKEFSGRSKADQNKELNAAAEILPRRPRACILDRSAATYIRAGGNMMAVWYTPRRTTEFDELYSRCQSALTPKVVEPTLAKAQSSVSHDCQLIRVEKKK